MHYQDAIHAYYDQRIATLGKIKARSVDAEVLTLTALHVLVYAQLGGVKGLAAILIKNVNARGLLYGQVAPALLGWRNPDDLQRFRSAVTFEMLTETAPFATPLHKHCKIRAINRNAEMNQMNWKALSRVYAGLRLDVTRIAQHSSSIDGLVEARNDAAHNGLPAVQAANILSEQVRDNATMVEGILTETSIQMLSYFSSGLHLR